MANKVDAGLGLPNAFEVSELPAESSVLGVATSLFISESAISYADLCGLPAPKGLRAPRYTSSRSSENSLLVICLPL